MANSLTIGIGADSSKLTADLALAQAKLRDFDKELRDTAKTGDVGATQEVAAKYEAQRNAVAGMKDELNSARSEAEKLSKSVSGAGAAGAWGGISASLATMRTTMQPVMD